MPSGYDLLDRENKIGVMPSITLHPVNSARYWHVDPSGMRTSLMLGSYENYSSSALLNCRNFANIDTSLELHEIKLFIKQKSVFGSSADITFTAHKVTKEWDEDKVLYDDILDGFDSDPVEFLYVTSSDSVWKMIQFTNNDFMSEWIKDAHRSERTIQGLLLQFEQANGAIEFYSNNSADAPPYFQVVMQTTDGELDTIKSYITQDASLIKYAADGPEKELERKLNRLRVGNGSGYRSILKFDFPDSLSGATIHQASLTLFVDQNESITQGDDFFVSAIAIVEDSSWQEPDSIKTDINNSPAIDSAFDSQLTFTFDTRMESASLIRYPVHDVSRIVQRWISDVYPNYGILLYPTESAKNFNEMYFYSGSANDDLMPELRITYSFPPQHRFATP